MSPISLMVALAASAVAATTDIRWFKVYNLLTFPLAGAGLAYHALAPSGLGVGTSSAGLAAGFLLLVIPYAVGILGAGDVKFAAAIGAWVGMDSVLLVVLIGCVGSGVFSAIIIFGRGGVKAIVRNIWSSCRSLVGALVGWRFGAPAAGDYREIAKQGDRRERLVPFTAMQSIGVLCVVVTKLVDTWPKWF